MRIEFGAAIATVLAMSSVPSLVHKLPDNEQDRRFSVFIRVALRLLGGAILLGLSFIPPSLLGEPYWELLICFVLFVILIVDLFGYHRESKKDEYLDREQDEADLSEHASYSVPFIPKKSHY